MEIIEQKTILKNSSVSNPEGASINAMVRPKFGIGFTFDRQRTKNIMVFAVHTSCTIEYTIKARFLFECYDGTVFNSSEERPTEQMLLPVIRHAIVRSNEMLRKELEEKKLTFSSNDCQMNFKDADILKMLSLDISESY